MEIPMSTSWEHAAHIMGKNYLGVCCVQRFFHLSYTHGELQQLGIIPYSKETLRACKDTHVLVAGAPLSMNGIRRIARSDFYDTDWYDHEAFANDKRLRIRWYLIRKEPVPESRGKTYDQQTTLLTKEEEVPFACEVTYMVILYWLVHGERLLPDVYVRCQEKASDGRRVDVGCFVSDGFTVDRCWDDRGGDHLGLASSIPSWMA
jgi:hypothetical protein